MQAHSDWDAIGTGRTASSGCAPKEAPDARWCPGSGLQWLCVPKEACVCASVQLISPDELEQQWCPGSRPPVGCTHRKKHLYAPQEVQPIGPDELEQQWCPGSGLQWLYAPKEALVRASGSSADWCRRARNSNGVPGPASKTPVVVRTEGKKHLYAPQYKHLRKFS